MSDAVKFDDPEQDPRERTLRLARTDPEFLDELAKNLHAHETRQWGSRAAWAKLPEPNRNYWRREVVRRIEENETKDPDQSWKETLEINDAALEAIERSGPPRDEPDGERLADEGADEPCPDCEGEGEVWVGSNGHPAGPDMGWSVCDLCGGSGKRPTLADLRHVRESFDKLYWSRDPDSEGREPEIREEVRQIVLDAKWFGTFEDATDRIMQLFRTPPTEDREADTIRLDWLEERATQFDYAFVEGGRAIYEIRGNINDRTWHMVSVGATLREAIDAALPTPPSPEGESER